MKGATNHIHKGLADYNRFFLRFSHWKDYLGLGDEVKPSMQRENVEVGGGGSVVVPRSSTTSRDENFQLQEWNEKR